MYIHPPLTKLQATRKPQRSETSSFKAPCARASKTVPRNRLNVKWSKVGEKICMCRPYSRSWSGGWRKCVCVRVCVCVNLRYQRRPETRKNDYGRDLRVCKAGNVHHLSIQEGQSAGLQRTNKKATFPRKESVIRLAWQYRRYLQVSCEDTEIPQIPKAFTRLLI